MIQTLLFKKKDYLLQNF